MKKFKLDRVIKAGLICMLLGASIKPAKSQEFKLNYTPLKSTGKLPEIFLKKPSVVSEEDIKNDRGTSTIKKDQFIRSTNYFISDLFHSGIVLVNDPLTAYVNKVAAEVIKQNPGIGLEHVQLFVTKSPEVNAYAFDKGYIFINIGLIAQLENEAQLAYIISHELIHISKKHSVAEYIENQRSNSYDKNGSEDRILAKYRFSKEQEREADVAGLDLIKKTNYSAKAVMGAFDVLQYSYLPFELPEFDKSFFEDNDLKIPDTLNLKKTSNIKTDDDYDDSKSSHPNIRKRRMSIDDDVRRIEEAGRKKYLVSDDANFKRMREISRFELCRIYLLKKDYVNAIYAAYILLGKYPDNLYLKKIVGRGLYNMVAGGSSNNVNSIQIGNGSSGGYEDIEGSSQRLYYLFEKLEAKELNVIALSYVYKAAKQYPKDPLLSDLTDSLFSSLVNDSKLYLNSFSKKTLKEEKDTTVKPVAVSEEEQGEESKYKTIKKIQLKNEESTGTGFIKYAFVGLLKDDEFVSRFRKAAKGLDHEAPEEYVSTKGKKKGSKSYQALGIKKIILMDPYYRKVTQSGNTVTVNYNESDTKRDKLTGIQKECADALKLECVNLNSSSLTADDVERYNQIGVINEWLAERFKYSNYEEVKDCSDAIKEIIAKNGTKYLGLMAVYNSNKKKNSYLFIVLDLETGKMLFSESRYNREKDSGDLLHSVVYNSFLHVVKEPQKLN